MKINNPLKLYSVPESELLFAEASIFCQSTSKEMDVSIDEYDVKDDFIW